MPTKPPSPFRHARSRELAADLLERKPDFAMLLDVGDIDWAAAAQLVAASALLEHAEREVNRIIEVCGTLNIEWEHRASTNERQRASRELCARLADLATSFKLGEPKHTMDASKGSAPWTYENEKLCAEVCVGPPYQGHKPGCPWFSGTIEVQAIVTDVPDVQGDIIPREAIEEPMYGGHIDRPGSDRGWHPTYGLERPPRNLLDEDRRVPRRVPDDVVTPPDRPAVKRCRLDTDGDGNCPIHPSGCPK